jgi:hypothetical protein
MCIRVVVYAARIPQHALEFSQFRVLHDDEQGVCGGEKNTNNIAVITVVITITKSYSTACLK